MDGMKTILCDDIKASLHGQDYFSAQSKLYARFRPKYPPALFEFLSKDLDPGDLIWDCGAGSGQATRGFDQSFQVLATDRSFQQLEQNVFSTNTLYVRALSESSPIASNSIALVTVAQALHWFDFESFYGEVDRVLTESGMIAVWTYSFLSASAQLGKPIDERIRDFYGNVVGPYWPPERKWVDALYRTIPFPFEEIAVPRLTIEISWSLEDLIGYISSWSAVAEYRRILGIDPVPQLEKKLEGIWGKKDEVRSMSWPIGLRVGKRSRYP